MHFPLSQYQIANSAAAASVSLHRKCRISFSEMAGIHFAATVSVFLCVLLATLPCRKADNQTAFDYSNGPNGPRNWGKINKEWRLCSKGKRQSPINIVRKNAELHPQLGPLRPFYKPSKATLLNAGHYIEAQWPSGGGWIMIHGTNFTLQQIHWHTPSEHLLNGERYDMEAHLVHKSSRNKTAVIGILYKFGRDDLFLEKLKKHIKSLVNGNEEQLGLVKAMDVHSGYWGNTKYYRYSGSLTTPPCTENIIWTILGKVKSVGRQQVKLLQKTLDHGFEHNARPPQRTNGRTVFKYKRPRSHF